MKKNTKRIVAFFILIALVVSCIMPTIPTKAAAQSSLGELADAYVANSSSFTLSTSSRFFVVANSEPAGELLQTVQLVQQQFAADGRPSSTTLEIVWGPENWAREGDIVVKLDSSSGIAAEGYSIDVSETATVTASDVDGLLYGLNMLQKYFRAADSNKLTGFTSSDTPDTKERTVMLDCARKYYTKEWICNFIREISWMGYNTIELHFSEDGGFRMDFWDPAYYTDNYSPENDFSWICGSQVQSWVKDPYRNDPDAGKFLTTAEVVEILKTAKEYHIDVIPSFDSPAHMDYLSWKFEQNYKSNTSYSFTYDGTTYKASSTSGCINYTGKTGESTPTWPYYTTIDITDGTMAKAFVFALYEDIADFFKEYAGSTDFAIGADEVNLTASSAIKWDYSAFPGYVNELNRMLNDKSYTCRMFNDFIGSTTYNQSSSSKAVYDFDDNIEIMYWNSDFNPTTGKWDENIWHVKFFWENNTGSTDNWGDGGRTLYNCIQTNCYYVLRVAASTTNYPNMDARNPENYNWTFYHSTEEDIYNEWYPADISEKGLYTENAADVPADQLGGAYFLIWNDYASLNTEAEVWNGVKDNTGTSSYTYSLLNRMWSSTIKMWNSDVNSTVDFDGFATVRDNFGYFPGYISCSEAASLPTATNPTQAYLADHSELTAALANKIKKGDYTEESYSEYEAVYAEAETVNAKYDATADELAAQVQALKSAEAALVVEKEEEDTYNTNLIIECKTIVNGEEKVIKTVKADASDSKFNVYLRPMVGYEYESIEGARYEALPSKDGSGFVGGTMKASGTTLVTVWYANVPNINRLQDLLGYALNEQGNYTDGSWSVYANALNSAKVFNVTDTTMQSHIDAIVASLESAQSMLTMEASETKIIEIEKVSETARLGKQVGLKITTTPDVSTLKIDGEELTLCTGKVQTLKTGETVKIWLVNFDADEEGTFSYDVHAGTASEKVEITVK